MTIKDQSTSSTAKDPATTLVPVAAQQAPNALAEQLERAAAAVRVASYAGFGEPAYLVVTEHGVTAQFDTAQLLQFAQLYDRRPAITAFVGSPYVATRGEIDGQRWDLHTPDPVPTDAATWTASQADLDEPAPAPEPEPAADATECAALEREPVGAGAR
jgi:hypothetical protein